MYKPWWHQRCLILIGLVVCLCGCGDPTLYELTGNVTLNGEPKERLIVYFDPVDKKIDRFNLGVGETDADGKLILRSTAGNGLAAGNYRVSFSYPVTQGGETSGLSDDKNESEDTVVVEMVPKPYNNRQSSPVEFQIKREKNEFVFDIPAN